MPPAHPALFPPPDLDEPAPHAGTGGAPSPVASAKAATAAAPRVAAGAFDPHAPGRDALHRAGGTVSVHRAAAGGRLTPRREGDLRAGPGPRFPIRPNTRPVGEERDLLADRGRAAAARLPRRATPSAAAGAGSGARAVTIWGEAFGAPIGSAAIAPVPAS